MRKATHKMTEDPTVIRILNELQKKEKTGKDLEQALGLPNGVVSKWKYLGIRSYKNYLGKIADYLNVSVEDLQNGFESELKPDEINLLEIYRKLDDNERCYLNQTMQYMLALSVMKKTLENKRENESESDENIRS